MNRQNLINSIPDLIDSSKEEFDTILFVPSVKDLTDDQKMEDEYELLGFYVSKHPLDSCSVRINDLFKINNLKNCQSNTMVNIGGLVIDPKIIKTKATKKDMCFFKLEDKTGRVEVIVFPNVYPRFERFLTKNNLVEIAGKVEVEEKTINDEEIIRVPKILLYNIKPLDKIKNVKELILSIRDIEKADEIKKILEQYPGPIQVKIEFLGMCFELEDGIAAHTEAMTKLMEICKIKEILDE